MKAKVTQLITLLILLLSACHDGERREMRDGEFVPFTAHIQYVEKGETKNDEDAKLYLFENFVDIHNYIFVDSKFVHKRSQAVQEPSKVGTANKQGHVSVYALYGRTYTIVVQSGAYPQQHLQTIFRLNSNQSQVGLRQIVFEEKDE